ncbi:ficolin-2-like [Topomyia yanbarensis]|uniref:ficolin-2-like n=1 Tax=Topomyia yanbarensis TaxID=2498891 RepID=UPI00273AE702|nr:ficolin-2-like [Topomyia yanbarensis]
MGLRYLATLAFTCLVLNTHSRPQRMRITGPGPQGAFNSLKVPETCKETPRNSSGVFLIHPDSGFGEPFLAQCDHEYKSGGWNVIQNRYDGSVNFYRDWCNYKQGFGHLDHEFWLGLDRINRLTTAKKHELHIVMTNRTDTYIVKYAKFAVASESEFYKLTVGSYSGPKGADSLTYHNGHKFTAFDRDYDDSPGNCAVSAKGAWWYALCYKSNLNGMYSFTSGGMVWKFNDKFFRMKTTRMLIRSV